MTLVVMPLLILKSTTYYDPDCSGSVLKVVVENRAYDSDNKGHEYYDIVNFHKVMHIIHRQTPFRIGLNMCIICAFLWMKCGKHFVFSI